MRLAVLGDPLAFRVLIADQAEQPGERGRVGQPGKGCGHCWRRDVGALGDEGLGGKQRASFAFEAGVCQSGERGCGKGKIEVAWDAAAVIRLWRGVWLVWVVGVVHSGRAVRDDGEGFFPHGECTVDRVGAWRWRGPWPRRR